MNRTLLLVTILMALSLAPIHHKSMATSVSYNTKNNNIHVSNSSGKYDHIISIGDLHGDMSQTFHLLRSLGIITYQPDYYNKSLLMARNNNDNNMTAHIDIVKNKGCMTQEWSWFSKTKKHKKRKKEHHCFPKTPIYPASSVSQYHWGLGRALVVILGDIMNKGPEDIDVLNLFCRLNSEAAVSHGGRLQLLLGNHEVGNLRGDYHGVHRESLKRFGGKKCRRSLLSTSTVLGRYVRSALGIYYYDGLLFMHGGLLMKAVRVVERATGIYKMDIQTFVDTINAHVRNCLFQPYGNQKHAIRDDDIASLVLNVDYDSNGKKGILLVHPLKKCRKIKKVVKYFGLQAQVVGHSPHPIKHWDFCHGHLYAIDFRMSHWKAGYSAPVGGVSFARRGHFVKGHTAATMAKTLKEWKHKGGDDEAVQWDSRLQLFDSSASSLKVERLVDQTRNDGKLTTNKRFTFVGVAVIGVIAVASAVAFIYWRCNGAGRRSGYETVT